MAKQKRTNKAKQRSKGLRHDNQQETPAMTFDVGKGLGASLRWRGNGKRSGH